MLPNEWKPIEAGDLVRVGAVHDGGYVLPAGALRAATTLVSMGLSTNWVFEEEYLDYADGRVICFDHTVTRGMWLKYTLDCLARLRWREAGSFLRYRKFFSSPRAEHRLQAIGFDNGDASTSLRPILRALPPGETVGLKVDIEGWEYRILDQIVEERERLEFVVIELHDVDLHRERVTSFFTAMEGFQIVWAHGNNYGHTDSLGDPCVVEFAVVPGRHVVTRQPDDLELRSLPNDASRPDVALFFDQPEPQRRGPHSATD